MDYLTYPFHNPSLAIPHASSTAAPHTAKSLNDENDLERLAIPHDPLIRRGTYNNEHSSSSSSSSCSSLAFADQASGSLINDNADNEEDDQSLSSRRRSPSTLSTTSSQLFIKQHNAAFNKLRTANNNTNGNAGGKSEDIPEEWKGYEPPSLSRGNWRTFGPVEAVLTVVDGAPGETHHTATSSSTTAHYRHAKKRLESANAYSSLWKGTIWLTETHLIFVLSKDAAPEKVDPNEMHDDASHTEHWVTSIRRMLGRGHRRHSEDTAVEGGCSPPTTDPETGYPITAFQISLSSLLNVKFKNPSSKHRGRKRNSVASSSTGGFLSPPESTPISPALSRIQTRNTRSPSRQRGQQSQALSRSQSRRRQGSPGGSRTPALAHEQEEQHHQPLMPTETQPLDFGDLINREEDPYKVVVYSESVRNIAKVEFRFMSGLYVDEARDLVSRLKELLQLRK